MDSLAGSRSILRTLPYIVPPRTEHPWMTGPVRIEDRWGPGPIVDDPAIRRCSDISQV